MTEFSKKLALYLSLFAVVAFAALLFAVAATAQTFSGSFDRTDWQGGRADLYKSGRWCAELNGDRVNITVQYQKQKHLLCNGEVCHGLAGTPWAWDNRGKLDEWHDSIRYTGIPVRSAPNSDYSDRKAFGQDEISGSLWLNRTRMKLRVNRPGRVVFSSATVSDATGC